MLKYIKADELDELAATVILPPVHTKARSSKIRAGTATTLAAIATLCPSIIDIIDTNALQCIGFVMLPLVGFGFLTRSQEDTLERPEHADEHSYTLSELLRNATTAVSDFATLQPLGYLCIDFGLALTIGLAALFWDDLASLRRSISYRKLPLVAPEGATTTSTQHSSSLRKQLCALVNQIDETSIKAALVPREGSPHSTAELDAQIQAMRERHDELHRELDASLEHSQEFAAAHDDCPHEPPAVVPEPLSCLERTAVALSNSVNGFITVAIYFADVLSDIQVILLLFTAREWIWAYEATLLLLVQFVAVYFRVLPYLRTTFGAASCHLRLFRLAGFPLGLIALDGLMLLEPFGMIAVLPLPQWLKLFLPAYKATRVIAEVSLESLPQCLLQSYILVVVNRRVHADATQNYAVSSADPERLRQMMLSLHPALPLAAALPTSIAISTLAMLKTWIELVRGARQAGLSLRARAAQLWHVGAGLPLDALQRGTIVDFTCIYRLDPAEISPLLNALQSNMSLTRLHLAESGLEWAPSASAAPLVEAMARSRAALAACEALIVCPRSGFAIPLDRIRGGGVAALTALKPMRFFGAGGPGRLEILLMADVLRKHRRALTEPATWDESKSVVALVGMARGGGLTRSAWEDRIKRLMVAGDTRRAHIQSLIALDVLRDVGFSVTELRQAGYTWQQLKTEGGFEARDFHLMAGLEARELRELAFTAEQLYDAAVFSFHQLRAAGISLRELRDEARCTAAELREGGISLRELQRAGYTADELRGAGASPRELRHLGYTPTQLRDAAFSAAELLAAAWSVADLKAAGFSVVEMREGGCLSGESAATLKRMGFTVEEVRLVGHPVKELLAAGYTPIEMASGCTAKELKAVGFTAKQLHSGGFSAADVRATGCRADEMWNAGFTASQMARGFSAKELKNAVGLTARELKDAGFTAREIKEGGGVTAHEFRSCGFAVEELRAAGLKPKALEKGGFKLKQLKAGGFTARELREAGYEWHELVIHCSCTFSELLSAGFRKGDQGMEPSHQLFRAHAPQAFK